MIVNNIQIEVIKNGFFNHNAYILIKNKKCIVIDPGSDYKKFNEFIKSRGLIIEFIIITHGHFDHFSALNRILSENTNIKYYGSVRLNEVITNKDLHLGHDEDSIIKIQNNILEDGDIINFQGLQIQCIETPGHLIDHICLYNADHKILFTGDILFKNNIGSTRFPTGSVYDLKKSLRKIFRMCDPKTVIFPGHGDISTLEIEKIQNPHLTFLD